MCTCAYGDVRLYGRAVCSVGRVGEEESGLVLKQPTKQAPDERCIKESTFTMAPSHNILHGSIHNCYSKDLQRKR